jgi:RNA polymerase sigma-70 factor (ECF subfamily)
VNVGEVYRAESRAVLATLIRLLGDFDLAEEALQDAFTAAVERWGDTPPANPRAWLVSTGRFKAIDRLRRRARFDRALGDLAALIEDRAAPGPAEDVDDDRLRLIFTCCHPALPADAQVAMTLREVCGLTTEEIARAFLTRPPTVAQRIVRAKSRIRTEGIPYEVPGRDALPDRLATVLHVVYLVFTEGYAPAGGDAVVRADLADEAIRLGRLLVALLPDAEAHGLLALMLLQDSRRDARSTAEGDLVLLADQDRSRWDRERMAEAAALLRKAGGGPYAIQAAIAAAHAAAPTAAATDWDRIVALYDALARTDPSPVVALNRAVAVSMRDGPAAGLALVDAIDGLDAYHLAHATRADLLRRLGRAEEARDAYARALALTRQEPQRRFLERRIAELYSVTDDSIGR